MPTFGLESLPCGLEERGRHVPRQHGTLPCRLQPDQLTRRPFHPLRIGRLGEQLKGAAYPQWKWLARFFPCGPENATDVATGRNRNEGLFFPRHYSNRLGSG
jgi:hypothetical protein